MRRLANTHVRAFHASQWQVHDDALPGPSGSCPWPGLVPGDHDRQTTGHVDEVLDIFRGVGA